VDASPAEGVEFHEIPPVTPVAPNHSLSPAISQLSCRSGGWRGAKLPSQPLPTQPPLTYGGAAYPFPMPELPEAERARLQIERALDREIVAVDDRDSYVCRPHAPGEIAAGLVGRRLTAAHRRGKFLWADTDGDGPELGLHLGMAGRIVVDEPPSDHRWDRFSLEFSDGGRLALRDKRRLGRAVLAPDFSHVGPDAAEVGRDAFRARVGRGSAPLKARLLDQGVIAGVGNLLADETLWRARLHPSRPAGELSAEELDHLRRELRAATRSAIRKGGVHTGDFIAHRARGGTCPRCGSPLERATVGGRTTFWCPACQAAPG
jgi:formamidopyrimidine-DNA glycosylase